MWFCKAKLMYSGAAWELAEVFVNYFNNLKFCLNAKYCMLNRGVLSIDFLSRWKNSECSEAQFFQLSSVARVVYLQLSCSCFWLVFLGESTEGLRLLFHVSSCVTPAMPWSSRCFPQPGSSVLQVMRSILVLKRIVKALAIGIIKWCRFTDGAVVEFLRSPQFYCLALKVI